MLPVFKTLVRRGLLGALLMQALYGCATTNVAPVEESSPPPVAEPSRLPPKHAPSGAIFNASTSVPLFEDIKARRVGDLLTVILEEKTNATKKASTSASKGSDISLANPTVFGREISVSGNPVLSASVDAERSFSGEGDSSQSNTLTGNVTVSVIQVQPNGNLVVQGQKLLTLNQGSEIIKITGLVRPIDIEPDNTVKSTEVANVEITYSGSGLIADSNRAGWLTRFFHSGWWPL